MIDFKACTRCKGDMVRGRDMYGDYVQCLQCGNTINIQSVRARFEAPLGRQRPGRPRKHKVTQIPRLSKGGCPRWRPL